MPKIIEAVDIDQLTGSLVLHLFKISWGLKFLIFELILNFDDSMVGYTLIIYLYAGGNECLPVIKVAATGFSLHQA
jgi:hypothetical protein